MVSLTQKLTHSCQPSQKALSIISILSQKTTQFERTRILFFSELHIARSRRTRPGQQQIKSHHYKYFPAQNSQMKSHWRLKHFPLFVFHFHDKIQILKSICDQKAIKSSQSRFTSQICLIIFYSNYLGNCCLKPQGNSFRFFSDLKHSLFWVCSFLRIYLFNSVWEKRN